MLRPCWLACWVSELDEPVLHNSSASLPRTDKCGGEGPVAVVLHASAFSRAGVAGGREPRSGSLLLSGPRLERQHATDVFRDDCSGRPAEVVDAAQGAPFSAHMRLIHSRPWRRSSPSARGGAPANLQRTPRTRGRRGGLPAPEPARWRSSLVEAPTQEATEHTSPLACRLLRALAAESRVQQTWAAGHAADWRGAGRGRAQPWAAGWVRSTSELNSSTSSKCGRRYCRSLDRYRAHQRQETPPRPPPRAPQHADSPRGRFWRTKLAGCPAVSVSLRVKAVASPERCHRRPKSGPLGRVRRGPARLLDRGERGRVAQANLRAWAGFDRAPEHERRCWSDRRSVLDTRR